MTQVSNTPIQDRESSIVELDLAALSAIAGGGRDPDTPNNDSDPETQGGSIWIG